MRKLTNLVTLEGLGQVKVIVFEIHTYMEGLFSGATCHLHRSSLPQIDFNITTTRRQQTINLYSFN